MKFQLRAILIASTLFLIVSVTACSQKQPEEFLKAQHPQGIIKEITTQDFTKTRIQPGLTVTYYLQYFKRNLAYLQQMKEGEFETLQGEPILQLNHQFGDRNVFDSGTNRGVAMRMQGFMFFPGSGHYEMQALSNDGVIVSLADHLILSDPRQHSDRLSDIAHITIDSKGWAPLMVEYFQRKGTSALKLYWKVPESEDFVPVPKTSFGHLAQ